MRTNSFVFLAAAGVLAACGGAATPSSGPIAATAADSAGIRALATTYSAAFSKGDASLLNPVLADDYQSVDPTGNVIQGKAALIQAMTAGMKQMPMPAGTTMSATTTFMRFLSPTSAIAGGTWSMSPAAPGMGMASRGAWMGAAVKKDSTWQMVSSLGANDDMEMMAAAAANAAKAKPAPH